jgi:hypothetical protein
VEADDGQRSGSAQAECAERAELQRSMHRLTGTRHEADAAVRVEAAAERAQPPHTPSAAVTRTTVHAGGPGTRRTRHGGGSAFK